MPTSASDSRHAEATPAARRRRASTHTTNPANGSPTSIMSSTPFSVSKQPCHRPARQVGADIISGRRRTNAAPASTRIATPTSTILRARPGGADRDALRFMPTIRDRGT